jgi:hypothetical protein
MLLRVTGIGNATAGAIADKFPTPALLSEALEKAHGEEENDGDSGAASESKAFLSKIVNSAQLRTLHILFCCDSY